MLILHKLIGLSQFLSKLQMTDKSILKFIQEGKRVRRAKAILKRNKVGGTTS